MEELKETRVLRFHEGTLKGVRSVHGLTASGAAAAVDTIQRWLHQQPHILFKDIPRCYLENILVSSKGSVVRSQQRLDYLCGHRTTKPRFFGDYDFVKDFPEFNGILKIVVMPQMTQEYQRIYILKNCGQEFHQSLCLNFSRMLCTFFEYSRFHDYSDGIIGFIDYTGVNFADLLKNINITDMQEGYSIMSKGYGLRLKGLHILTDSKLVNILFGMIKQIVGKKLGDRIMAHGSIESVCEHIPRDLLPAEYGGKEKPLDDLYEDWLKELRTEESRANLRLMMRARTDEALRPPGQELEDSWGVSGSFRALSVD